MERCSASTRYTSLAVSNGKYIQKPSQCKNPAKVTRNGKHFCLVHDPERYRLC